MTATMTPTTHSDDGPRALTKPNMERIWTDDELIDELKRWATEHGDPVSVQRYQSVADEDFPSSTLYQQRFGSWNEAKRRAGLIVTPARSGHRRQFTEQDCRNAVAAYVAECATAEVYPAYARYEKLAREVDSWPSGQLVRNRLGRWGVAVQEAMNHA